MVIVLLYIDGMIVASNDLKKLEEIKCRLSIAFEMKDLGEPKNFLGITIKRNREEKYTIIHQTTYAERFLEKCNIKECKSQNTPMASKQVNDRIKRVKLYGKEISGVTQKEEIKRYHSEKSLEV